MDDVILTRTTAHREPLTDPATGKPLPQREQPGYYHGYQTLRQQKFWDQATRDVVLARVQHQQKIEFFNESEARTMLAVVDRIMPQDDRLPEKRIPILPSLDHRLKIGKIQGYRYEDMPPDGEAYRIAVRAIELMAQRLHGCRFDELPTLDQEKLLKSIHDADPAEAHEEWAKMNIERFWTMLVGDVCSVYYAHPWAWDEIGYGGPAYPRGYMRLTEGEPEPYEVNEQRYEWAAPADTLSDVAEAHGTGKTHQSGDEGGTH
jgi:hypothetical protein